MFAKGGMEQVNGLTLDVTESDKCQSVSDADKPKGMLCEKGLLCLFSVTAISSVISY